MFSDQESNAGGRQADLHCHTMPYKKILCACIGAAALVTLYASVSRAEGNRALAVADTVGVMSAMEAGQFSPRVKEKFMMFCIGTFKDGNSKIRYFPDRRFAEKGLEKLCNKYWTGYLKAFTPWTPGSVMFPDANRIGVYGDMCQSRDFHKGKWWQSGSFLFPDQDENGNKWIEDCSMYIDLVAETNSVTADDVISDEKKDCKAKTGNPVKIKDGYCHTTRVGLGKDTVHGQGNPSLVACGEAALSDDRCSGDGYFDASQTGSTFQCKCPMGTCMGSTNPQAHSWAIYKEEPSTEPHCK